jgi:magnesium transporter
MLPEEICARRFVETHPEDAARLIEQASLSTATPFLEGLPPRAAAGAIERMNPAVAAHCVATMRPHHAAAVIVLLAPATAAALLRRTAAGRRDELLALLPHELEARCRRLLSYPEGTVGSVTDPGVLALSGDVSVGEALRHVRRFHHAAHHHVYVVDRDQLLEGLVHLRALVGSRPREPLADVMQPVRVQLAARSRLVTAAVHPGWREFDALPVADESGVLLGMVRHRQIRQLDVPPGPGGLASALVGLGELYWMTLSAWFPVGATAQDDRATSPSVRGDHTHD